MNGMSLAGSGVGAQHGGSLAATWTFGRSSFVWFVRMHQYTLLSLLEDSNQRKAYDIVSSAFEKFLASLLDCFGGLTRAVLVFHPN